MKAKITTTTIHHSLGRKHGPGTRSNQSCEKPSVLKGSHTRAGQPAGGAGNVVQKAQQEKPVQRQTQFSAQWQEKLEGKAA